MKHILIKLALIIPLVFCFSCKKIDKFLEQKPSTSLVIPETLNDLTKLLDNTDLNISGSLGYVCADDYYLPDLQSWESLTEPRERNGYIWAEDLYQGTVNIEDWSAPYMHILYANIVLEALDKFKANAGNENEYDRVKGHALFLRGHALFNLSQHFAEAYDATTANSAKGVPIRLKSDVTAKSKRATLQQTYDQIIKDLKLADDLLPHKEPGNDRNRPYKVAAQALLARVYLTMRKYDSALQYAESALNLYSRLMSFSSLSTTSNFPIITLNPESIFYCILSNYGSLLLSTRRPNTLVNTELYDMYAADDLRRVIFFVNSPIHQKPCFKASYTGTTRAYSGLATDELYLIKAECQVRLKDYQDGLNTLNSLLVTRWKKDTFINLTASNRNDALEIVLRERRKELPMRGLRWQDLRRLNKGGANITLTRTLGETTYTLPPNSLRYVMPIPADEIRLNGLEQNDR